MFDTERKGERVSTADGCCLRAAAVAFGFVGVFLVDVVFVVDFGLTVDDLGLFAGFGLFVGLGLVFFVLSGTGDRNLDGVRGVRGPLGVGGSRRIKWHGRVIFFFESTGDRSTERRAGTGMRLGELWGCCCCCC